ncbi:MAG: aminoglycoside phosphotransferase family protein [Firmicutes bacterium]|nr:aminoglycoside phosphotransferase family protein [Bacillota bacterium]
MNNTPLSEPYFIINYLEKQGLFNEIILVTSINNGASRAKLIDVTDRRGRYVIKHTHPLLCENDINMMYFYEKEWKFYSLFQENAELTIPQVIYIERNPDYGNIIVFPHYKRIEYSLWSTELQLKAIDFCAKLHSLNTQLIKELDVEYKNICPDNEKLYSSLDDWNLDDWNYVLSLHEGHFDKEILKSILKRFDRICDILNSHPYSICHGDFHADNIMLNNEDLVVCDWQNVGLGKGASDVSFFISRGKAAGIDMNEDNLIAYYCERLSNYTKTEINKTDIYNTINASTVFVSFMFWAYYLKNVDFNSVSKVYNKMINSFIALNL